MNFINVVPLFPEHPEHSVSEIRRQKREAGIDKIAICLSCHPEGTPARDKIDLLLSCFRKIRKEIEESNPEIEIGVLIQSTMGHGWSGRVPLTREIWQKTMNSDGAETSRFCLLDGGFRQYILSAVTDIVREGASFLLLDDDFGCRGNECFCPLHLRQFNEATGKNYTREEIAARFVEKPWDDPDIRTFSRLRAETSIAFAGEIRAAIDRVNPRIRCAVCTPGAGHGFIRGEAFALSTPLAAPAARVDNAIYGMQNPLAFYGLTARTHMVRRQLSGVPDLLDETDTFPQNCYSESATVFDAHIINGILNGLNGCKLWIGEFGAFGYPRNTQARFEKMFASRRGLYDALLNTVDGVRWRGTDALLFSVGEQGRNPYSGLRRISEVPDWNQLLTGPFAVPIQYTGIEDAEGIVTLTGPVLREFSDEEIRELFSRNLLIDSTAAKILTERGFAAEMGVRADDGGSDFFFSAERCPESGENTWIMWDDSAARLECVSPETKVVTEFVNAPGKSLKGGVSFPGMTFFTNARGGRVAVTGWTPCMPYYKTIRDIRRDWILRALDFLNGGTLEMTVETGDQVLVRHGLCKDGTELLALLKLCIDHSEDIPVRCIRAVRKVERMTSSGEWESAAFHWDGGLLRIARELVYCRFEIFRLSF